MEITFETLKSKTADGQIVVERVVPKLAKLSFCKKVHPVNLQQYGIVKF